MTYRQLQFCRYYATRPHAPEAALAAGYARSTVETNAGRLLKSPSIVACIERLRRRRPVDAFSLDVLRTRAVNLLESSTPHLVAASMRTLINLARLPAHAVMDYALSAEYQDGGDDTIVPEVERVKAAILEAEHIPETDPTEPDSASVVVTERTQTPDSVLQIAAAVERIIPRYNLPSDYQPTRDIIPVAHPLPLGVSLLPPEPVAPPIPLVPKLTAAPSQLPTTAPAPTPAPQSAAPAPPSPPKDHFYYSRALGPTPQQIERFGKEHPVFRPFFYPHLYTDDASNTKAIARHHKAFYDANPHLEPITYRAAQQALYQAQLQAYEQTLAQDKTRQNKHLTPS